MKKIFVILVSLFIAFIGMNSINASNKIIKTETNDKVIFVQEKDGSFNYSWTFSKKEYNDNDLEFNTKISFESPFKKKIDKILEPNVKREYVHFEHDGELPAVASVKVPVKNFEDKDRLTLYYYNDKTNKLEETDNNILVANGYVTLQIKRCASYVLTLTTVSDAIGKNNNGIIIVGMLIVIVGLVGYTIFNNKR